GDDTERGVRERGALPALDEFGSALDAEVETDEEEARGVGGGCGSLAFRHEGIRDGLRYGKFAENLAEGGTARRRHEGDVLGAHEPATQERAEQVGRATRVVRERVRVIELDHVGLGRAQRELAPAVHEVRVVRNVRAEGDVRQREPGRYEILQPSFERAA